MKLDRLVLAGFGASLLLAGASAFAAPVTFSSCVGDNYDISGKVDPNLGCTISDTDNQDFLNTDPMTVNKAPGFFDITDWMFDGKLDEPFQNAGFFVDGSSLVDFSWNGDIDSGSWALTAAGQAVQDLMLVFKSGSGTTLVGYLLASGGELAGLSGTWDNPFQKPPFNFTGASREVSHISVYHRGTVPVPAPGALGLLGAGLLGLALVRRRIANA